MAEHLPSDGSATFTPRVPQPARHSAKQTQCPFIGRKSHRRGGGQSAKQEAVRKIARLTHGEGGRGWGREPEEVVIGTFHHDIQSSNKKVRPSGELKRKRFAAKGEKAKPQ